MNIKIGIVVITLLGIMNARFAHAQVITTGCAEPDHCTVQELLDGGQIRVDRLIFSNFRPALPDVIDDPGSSSGVIFSIGGSDFIPIEDGHPANPGEMTVTAIGVGSDQPGIRIDPNGQWTVTGDRGGAQGTLFSYQVSSVTGSVIIGSELVHGPGEFIPGLGSNESYVESYLLKETLTDADDVLDRMDFEWSEELVPPLFPENLTLGAMRTFKIERDPGDLDPSEEILADSTSVGLQNFLQIVTAVVIDTNEGGTVPVITVDQTFSVVPEPTTIAILAVGSVALLRRRLA